MYCTGEKNVHFPPLALLGNLNSKSPPVMQSEYAVQEQAAYLKKNKNVISLVHSELGLNVTAQNAFCPHTA